MGDGRCRCCCISYQTRVVLFAVTNVFLTGVQLFLPLISSSFIIYFQATKQNFEAKYILREETLSIFQRIPSILLRPPDSTKISLDEVGSVSHSPLQSDIHVWASWIFVKFMMLCYSVLLYSGARKKNYNLVLCWFALNLPMALHSLIQLSMDLGLGIMRKKPLNFQIYQYALSTYQLLGLLFVFFFLRNSNSRRGVLYPEYKRDEVKFRDPASLHFMYGHPRRDFEVDERYYEEL